MTMLHIQLARTNSSCAMNATDTHACGFSASSPTRTKSQITHCCWRCVPSVRSANVCCAVWSAPLRSGNITPVGGSAEGTTAPTESNPQRRTKTPAIRHTATANQTTRHPERRREMCTRARGWANARGTHTHKLQTRVGPLLGAAVGGSLWANGHELLFVGV